MKNIFIIFFFVLITVPSTAQWKNASKGGQVLAFGVHDTSLFLSLPFDPNDPEAPLVWRLVSLTPNVIWRIADTGIDFSQGNVTSFASLGPYFFAGSGPPNAGAGYRLNANSFSWQDLDTIGGPVGTNGTYLFGQYATRIARSRDSGRTWEHLSVDAGNSYAGNGACVFANTDFGIQRSLDSGGTWLKISPPFDGNITRMDSLYFMVGSSNGSVIESTDIGSHWDTVAVDSGSVQEHVNCLATDGINLFAGTQRGVLVSTDIGKSWTAKNDSLYNLWGAISPAVTQMIAFDSSLFIEATYGTGKYYVFDRPIRELIDTAKSGVQQAPQSHLAISSYPNPLSQSTSITFTLPEAGEVTLTISDAAGRETPLLHSAWMDAGEHAITWDATHIPSGVYLCRLSSGGASVTERVVVVH